MIAASSTRPDALAQRVRRANARETRAALPALVDAVAAALASGLSLPVALAEVAPTLPPGLAAPTRRAASALALGAPVGDALGAYSGVVPDEDVAPLAVVLSAFARSGGRVGGSLARVAALMRGRLALEDERAALTAQGRVSAIVLVALAPLGALFFALATPGLRRRSSSARASACSAIAVALEIIGALWLWRIVRATAPPPDLATFLDAVVVGLEAGLTFERALAALVERAPRFGRLSDARRLLADLALGRSLPDALGGFGRGGDDARIAALVVAATRFGAPLAGLLVIQADALRTAERRRAEAEARRLPVLMLFPLVAHDPARAARSCFLVRPCYRYSPREWVADSCARLSSARWCRRRVIVLIPALILSATGTEGEGGVLRLVGLVPLVLGIAILAWCFAGFIVEGEGTPAPYDPPHRLVTGRLYGWMRNPMYVAVMTILLGEAMFYGSVALLLWAVVMRGSS